ncbi:MAG: 4a-hydroxytetrahydrobiopterin dehydratase [Phycisphaerales bacterium JB063]
MPTPLTDDQIANALADLPGWTRAGDKLHKQYKLDSFREAMAFLVRIGFEAEQRNHHPELFNVYSTVRVELCTHDAGDKVTQKDTDLASAIEKVSRSY